MTAVRSAELKARDEIVASNMGLVKSVVEKYGKGRGNYSYDDLVQEGVIALLNAVNSYSSDTNVQFSTYAYVAIRNRILSYVAKNSTSFSMTKTSSKRAFAVKKNEESGTPLSIKDMANSLNTSVESLMPFYERCCVSLDDTCGEQGCNISDIIPDWSVSIEESYEKKEMTNDLYRAITLLSAEDRSLLIKFFGLDRNEPTSLSKIAKSRNVSLHSVHNELRCVIKRLKNLLKYQQNQ